MKKLIVLFALIPMVAFPQVTLTWTPPTQNQDGTPLVDLANYKILYGCNQSGQYDVVELIQAPASTYTINNLPGFGTCYFAAQSINAVGTASILSNEASKFMGSSLVPNAPTSLVATCGVPPSPSLPYSLIETNFGPPVVAGNWSVPGQSLVIDFEITPRSYPFGDERIISKAVGPAEQDHYFMVSMMNGTLRFRLKTQGITSTLFGSVQIPLNVKTLGQVTYDGVNMSIYINGQLDAQRAKTGDMDASTAEVWVGANPPDSYRNFDGLISVTVN